MLHANVHIQREMGVVNSLYQNYRLYNIIALLTLDKSLLLPMSMVAQSEEPSPKRRKQTHKLCGHCNKELNKKIIIEHNMLYHYPATKRTKELEDENRSSSELESLDEILKVITLLGLIMMPHSVRVIGAGRIH